MTEKWTQPEAAVQQHFPFYKGCEEAQGASPTAGPTAACPSAALTRAVLCLCPPELATGQGTRDRTHVVCPKAW